MKKSMKKLTAAIYTVFATATLGIGSVTAFAADTKGIIDWGNSLIGDIKTIGQLIGVGAVIILAIMCMTAGRGWAEKLKTGAAGIIIGIALLGFGTSIVMGLFDSAEANDAANNKTNVRSAVTVVDIQE